MRHETEKGHFEAFKPAGSALHGILAVYGGGLCRGGGRGGECRRRGSGGGGGGTPPGGGSSTDITWAGATTITSAATETGKTYTSTTADQNALLINIAKGVEVNLNNPTVTKSGGTSASDNYSFYGINSGIMVKGGGTVNISGGTVTTNAAGANGVFSYGGSATTNNTSTDGTTVNISDVTITTTGSGSGGIMTTGGGTTNAYNLNVTTGGGSSAAIRTDRGGGIVNVDGGTYKTTGTGSPAIYATATITVKNATLTSTASQGVVNEGGNNVYLYDCTLNAGNKTRNGQDYFNNGVFLYQSNSGDAADGASVFEMYRGTLNNTYGHVFHVTNTSAAITLEEVSINNADSANVFLSVCDDAWSSSGKLGNTAKLTASKQEITGDMLVGSNATLNLFLTNGSAWTGTTSGKITAHKSNTSVSATLGTVNVTLDAASTWTLTADTYITKLTNTGVTNNSNINLNGHTLYVNGTAITSTGYATHTHSMTAYPAVAATCTADGNSAYWYCAGCGKYFSDASGENEIEENSWVIAGGHSLTAAAAKNATAAEAGNIDYWYCSQCEKYFSDEDAENEITQADTVIEAYASYAEAASEAEAFKAAAPDVIGLLKVSGDTNTVKAAMLLQFLVGLG